MTFGVVADGILLAASTAALVYFSFFGDAHDAGWHQQMMKMLASRSEWGAVKKIELTSGSTCPSHR